MRFIIIIIFFYYMDYEKRNSSIHPNFISYFNDLPSEFSSWICMHFSSF